LFLVFPQLDSEFLKEAAQAQDGSTCLIALIKNNILTVGNVGDSSAILIRNNQILELSSEHIPTRRDEYQRIINCNGYIVPIGNALRV
jgi:serine/threonine protein phosphatase PrpC